MRTLARLVATTSVLLAVAACGTATSGGESSSPSTSQPDPAASTVVSVMLHRSGGLKPIEVDRTFSVDSPPPAGFSQQDVDAVIAAAGKLPAGSTGIKGSPANICCDRYVYTIIVTYADGSSQTISTADGVKQSPELAALLSDMS